MSDSFVELNRTFLEVTKDRLEVDVELRASLARHTGELRTWKDIHDWPVTAVLAEIGAGKTAEFQNQARLLRARAQNAFFVPVEALAGDGLPAALLEDKSLFESWRVGDEIAYFFLDSVDEARLRHLSLEKAIRKFKHGVGDALSRARVIVSCRPSDWDASADEAALEYLSNGSGTTSSEVRVAPVDGRSEPGVWDPFVAPIRVAETHKESSRLGDDTRKSTCRLVHLLPLDEEQIATLVRSSGLADWERFLAELRDKGAHSFARRPWDVSWLVSYWRQHGALGRLATLVDHAVTVSLRDAPARRTSLSGSTARSAVGHLAATLALTAKSSILIPGFAAASSGGGTIDPQAVLADRSMEEIQQLLTLPIFYQSRYGQIKFQNHTIQDYLAAEWLLSLLDSGLPRREFEGLFFPEIRMGTKEPVLPLHLRSLAAWTALQDTELRNLLCRLAPGVLIGEGDPGGLPEPIRDALLRIFVDGFSGRERAFVEFDRSALHRFASEGLAKVLLELISRSDLPRDVVTELLGIVREGAVSACATRALELAVDRTESDDVRLAAIAAVSAAGSRQQAHQLLSLLDSPSLPEPIAFGLAQHLYPTTLDLEALLTLISKCEATPGERSSALEHYLETDFPRLCPADEMDTALSSLASMCFGDDNTPARTWLAGTVAAIIERQAQRGDNHLAPWVLDLIERVGSAYHLDHARGILWRLLRRRPDIRRALFWQQVAKREQEVGRRVRNFFGWIMPTSLNRLGVDDLEWLKDDALASPIPSYALLAFDTLIRLPLSEEHVAAKSTMVHDLARADSRFQRHLERHGRDVNSSVILPGHFRYQHIAIERRRQHTLQENTRALNDVVAQIRTGTHQNALLHLYEIGKAESTNYREWNAATVAETYGEQLATAAADGLRRYWKTAAVPTKEGWSENGMPVSALLTLAGVSLDHAAGVALRDLPAGTLSNAARAATWEINGFPPWLEEIASAQPNVAESSVRSHLERGWRSPKEGREGFPWSHLRASSGSVRLLATKVATELISGADPGNVDTLEAALDLLSDRKDLIARIAPKRCRAVHNDPETAAQWWCAWAATNPGTAIAHLKKLLDRSDSASATALMVEVLKTLYEYRSPFEGQPRFSAVLRKDVGLLVQLVPLAYTHVSPEDDLVHHGVHRVVSRDRAQSVRDQLINWVDSGEPRTSLQALERLATDPRMRPYRDLLSRRKETIRLNDPACLPFELSGVQDFATSFVRTPNTPKAFLTLAADRVDDIKRGIESGPRTYRELFNTKGGLLNEDPFKRWVAAQLDLNAAPVFTVTCESEVGYGNYPDIHLHCAAYRLALAIETKIAERWTYEQLVAALQTQLLDRYLASPEYGSGILLLASAKRDGNTARKRWRGRDGTMLNFPGLLDALKKEAIRRTRRSGALAEVIGIDFHGTPPQGSDSEKHLPCGVSAAGRTTPT